MPWCQVPRACEALEWPPAMNAARAWAQGPRASPWQKLAVVHGSGVADQHRGGRDDIVVATHGHAPAHGQQPLRHQL
jgi:hypothetical protein